MADTFFPAILQIINKSSILSFLYHDVIFPEAIAQDCPEYVWRVNSEIQIRQPFLMMAALWGLAIGFWGYMRLSGGTSSAKYWAWAFWTFGLMNASAIFVHCLWPAPTIDYPTDYPCLWVIDTYMTGVSGSHLLIASLQDLQDHWNIQKWIRSLGALSNMMQTIGVLCILYFVINPFPSMIQASHLLEVWYLQPPALAAIPVATWMFDNSILIRGTTRRAASGIPALSISQVIFASALPVIAILGIGMDRIWCPLVGYSAIRDFLSANTLIFIGCDLAFLGIALRAKRPNLKGISESKGD